MIKFLITSIQLRHSESWAIFRQDHDQLSLLFRLFCSWQQVDGYHVDKWEARRSVYCKPTRLNRAPSKFLYRESPPLISSY